MWTTPEAMCVNELYWLKFRGYVFDLDSSIEGRQEGRNFGLTARVEYTKHVKSQSHNEKSSSTQATLR